MAKLIDAADRFSEPPRSAIRANRLDLDLLEAVEAVKDGHHGEEEQ